MDLHISNLAPETTANALKNYLRTKFKSLSISIFECKKPKGKRYGFITVPFEKQGQLLLRAFGTPGSLRFVNPLTLKRGKDKPDPQLVESLRNRQRDAIEHEQIADLPTHQKHKFVVDSVACGVITFLDGRLCFLQAYECNQQGHLIFGRKGFALSTPFYNPNSPEQTTKIEIEYASIEKALTYGISEPTITVNLYHSPKFIHLPKKAATLQDLAQQMARLSTQDADKPRRVRGINDEHAALVPLSFTYHIRINTHYATLFKNFLSRSNLLPTAVRLSLPRYRFETSLQNTVQVLDLTLERTPGLDFATKFQLQRLAQNGILPPLIVIRLVPLILKMVKDDPFIALPQALRHLSRQIPWPGPDTEPSEFDPANLCAQIEEALEGHSLGVQYALAQRHSHLFLVHQATVTPTGVYLEGPELCPANRVLRNHRDHVQSHFLRVKFEDENGDAIRFDRTNSLEAIHTDWFKKIILDGCIRIAGQPFSFLGFSNSSLKEQSCWFMAPIVYEGIINKPWDVVERLGDFSHIRSPAKCAARIGQAFSDTQGGAVDLHGVAIQVVDDVERNGRVFSDGCGTVSKKVLKRIWKTYRRHVHPTCFQIRYAGAKGMVSLDSRLDGEQLHIRKSMTKFTAPDSCLEICEASRRALPFFLNRQMIKILEDLGVPDKSFQDLQNNAVANLRANADSPSRAASFLDRFGIGKGCHLPWFIEKLDELGISCFDDKFLTSCIEHTVLMQLRMIKHKTRILVPNAYTLYGVMDETGTLKEREIVCRANGKTVSGIVAITRSPALHPGDIQVVRAVTLPSGSPLSDLDNCVIFSQHGDRDLPSMLSGGDLDGDLYNVIFDQTIRPRVTYSPADYPRVKQVDLYRQVTSSDITDWFIKFMQNDQLSRIAMAHQRAADYKPDGVLDPVCLKLAELHSTAVDFQKSGIPVDWKQIPKIPDARPDFMAPDPRMLINADKGGPEKFDKDDFEPSDDEAGPDAAIDPDVDRKPRLFYQSQKILGKLYRAIDEQAFLEEFTSAHDRTHHSGVTKRLFDHVSHHAQALQWKHLIDWAREVRQEYEEQVIDLMYWHSTNPRHSLLELEVFTGDIIGKGGSLPSRKMRENAQTLRERFNEAASYVVQRIIHGGGSGDDSIDRIPEDAELAYEFEMEPNWADTSEIRDQALERSIACLYVSMEKGEYWKSIGRRLESFQYVAGMVALREVEIFKRRTATSFMGLEILQPSY